MPGNPVGATQLGNLAGNLATAAAWSITLDMGAQPVVLSQSGASQAHLQARRSASREVDPKDRVSRWAGQIVRDAGPDALRIT